MFGDKLIALLKENKISAYKLSKETGISEGLIGAYKKGSMIPSGKNLKKIADYFHVPIDYLLSGENKQTSSSQRSDDTVQVHIMDFHGKEPEVITIPREKYEKMQRLLRAYEAEEEREKKHDPGIF